MVYQPAFYYMRVPINTSTDSNRGTQIEKEQIFISMEPHSGFSLFPLFYDANGHEVPFVLLSAYEGSAKRTNGEHVLNDAQNITFGTDQLASIPNAKPISGRTQNFNTANAKLMASNIGTGWSINTLEAIAAEQILMMIEYGSCNLQNEFNRGICDITVVNGVNCSATTGATASLGDASGQASSTSFTINDNTTSYTAEGYCSISYRGVENPYGNIWEFVDNLKVAGNKYIFNNQTTNCYTPQVSGWCYTFNFDNDFKWAFLPYNTSSNANSSVPIGDQIYVNINNNTKNVVVGGYATYKDNVGPFAYGLDVAENDHKHNYSARLLFTPTANSTVATNNYTAWQSTL